MDARDVQREAEILTLEVLGQESFPMLEAIVDLVSRMCGGATAEVNVITATEQVHLATSDRNRARLPRGQSFCGTAITVDDAMLIHVPDAARDPRFADNPFVTGELASFRSYAARKVLGPSGTVIGTLCVFVPPAGGFGPEQLRLLELLGPLVTEALRLHRGQVQLRIALDRHFDGNRELHRSHASLEAFAGEVSHDLQGPLAAVSLALQMLSTRSSPPAGTDEAFLLDTALSGTARMRRTVGDMLDFAMLGGRGPGSPVRLDEVVAQVLDDLDRVAGEAEVRVGALPAVIGHEVELRSVLQNLIGNAIKHSAPLGRPHVAVEGRRRGDRVRVTVTDNGPGVPEELRDDVFGLFARGDEQVEGRGIGLATCARIVHSRGGTIGVHEGEGGGAAFWFELPAAD